MGSVVPPTMARVAATSVYEYIAETAEATVAGVRWRTSGPRGTRHYDAPVAQGVAGIVFFLSDYWTTTGDDRARQLADEAVRWCANPQRLARFRGMCAGRTGVGMAYLRHAVATGKDAVLRHATDVGDWLVAEAPRPVTDFWAGAAGKGVYLLRLWEATGDDRYLRKAVEHADWLRSMAVVSDMGCRWPVSVAARGSRTSLGFGHGVAGVAYFLALLTTTTGDRRWADLVLAVAATLESVARETCGLRNWPTNLGDDFAVKCQWCHGAAGIGQFYIQAFRATGDARLLDAAREAGETTHALGDIRANPSQCHGLAGNGELLVELYRETGDARWLSRAAEFASMAEAYRHAVDGAEVWQSDAPGEYSQDFLYGAAGTGHFFLRVASPDEIAMPLM